MNHVSSLFSCVLFCCFFVSCMIPGFETAVVYYTYQYMPCHQGYLNTLASWSVAGGPHEHWDPLLIYICCDLLSIKKYYTILNYKYLFLCYKWTLAFISDLASRSTLQPHVHVCIRMSYATKCKCKYVNITSTHLTVNCNDIGYIYMPLVIRD